MDWISIKDRLPELKNDNGFGKFSDNVLTLHSDGHHEDCVFSEYEDGDGFFWYYVQDGDLCETVTHWMPLPEPPKTISSTSQ